MVDSSTDRYGVMGNPIVHSKSPRIHALFAEQTAQDLLYTAILAPRDGFVEAIRAFQAQGGKGLNITVPFKLQAWELMDAMSLRAHRAGAVNTILFREDGSCYGENTDGVGLVRDLRDNHRVPIKDQRILLLGAGGASRGVLGSLLEESPVQIVIANRTPAKARDLAFAFGGLGPLEGCGFPDLQGRSFDLIINATAAGLHHETPPLPDHVLARDGGCYDMMYGDKPTAFVRWGQRHGAAKSLDGLGMLVEQAAESFFIWRGVRPDTGPVIEALRCA